MRRPAEGQDLRTVERALDEELARFLAEGPTRAELERAKTEIRAGFIRGVEQVGGFRGKSNILAESAVYGGRPDFYQHSLGVLNGATQQQVLATARKWIQGDPLVVEIHPFPDRVGAERYRRGSLDSCRCRRRFPRRPFRRCSRPPSRTACA